MPVALVTDSTAYLPDHLVALHGIAVVPLHVAADGREFAEGVDLTEADLVRLLRRAKTLTTSRPSPRLLYDTYERLAAAGATEIVSAHLSGELSGTCEAARLAGRSCSVPVHVVDSGSMGMALGHAVLTGARLAEAGATGEQVAAAVQARARAGDVFFYVHTLEFLRRGGRIGNGAAFIGSALAMRPLLRLTDGTIEPLEKVRTVGRAFSRLVDIAVTAAERAPGRTAVTVHHLDDAARAETLANELRSRVGDGLAGDILVRPIGAVAAVHLGPGAMAVALSPEPGDDRVSADPARHGHDG